MKAQRDEGVELIRQEPVSIEEIQVSHSLDMQFVGQTHILHVPLSADRINHEAIQLAFDEAYSHVLGLVFRKFGLRLSTSKPQSRVVDLMLIWLD